MEPRPADIEDRPSNRRRGKLPGLALEVALATVRRCRTPRPEFHSGFGSPAWARRKASPFRLRLLQSLQSIAQFLQLSNAPQQSACDATLPFGSHADRQKHKGQSQQEKPSDLTARAVADRDCA